MGIYSDSMTRKRKKNHKNKNQDKKKKNTNKREKKKKEILEKKKLQKKKVLGRVERIYIDGLSEYVRDGCEDNVVLNIVITF